LPTIAVDTIKITGHQAMRPPALKSVLVPIDFSPLSDRVVRRAVSLPITAGGTITLLHVVPNRLRIRARRQAEKAARATLASEASRASKSLRSDISIEHAVGVGAAAEEIAAYAARLKADLVVMGRGAGRPLRDSFLGSTAERVIRQARMPVLAVRLPVRAPYRRPTLGLDLDDAAEPVLAMLLRVIPPPRPRITIIHAHDTPYFGMTYAGADESDQDDQWYRKTAVLRLGALIARGLSAPGKQPDDVLDFNTYIRRGHPRNVIKSAVRKLDTDILFLGTHGHSGVAQVFLGTVAGDVLREVSCDVLVVPPRRPGSRRN
jgi:nucleotide-binding universal stress UspA family protein